MSKGAILAALLEENRNICKPPLEKAEVEQIAASVSKYQPSNCNDSQLKDAKDERKSQATILVELADKAELFHDSEYYAFATIAFKDHKETWAIKCKGFRRWLAGQFWQAYHRAPGAQAIQNALAVLKYKAVF